jgi:NADPH:quinone reductase
VKAIVVEKTGGPEVLQLKDIPKPVPRAGEALVKNAAAGINFIDVYFRTGLYKKDPPFTVGQEGAGKIEAFGEGTDPKSTPHKAGERVCYAAANGSYAEYSVLPVEKLVPIPGGVDDIDACVTMVQGMTAQYLSHDTYPIRKGDTVLIHAAAGGVGQLLVQMAKIRGARVIATVGSEEKAKLARHDGADEVINYTTGDFEAEVKRITSGQGVHCVYDSVGKTTWEKSLNSLRPRGYFVLFGQSSGPIGTFDPQLLAMKGSLFMTRPTLVNYTMTQTETLTRAAQVFEMIATGGLKVRHGGVYKLAEAAQAHRDLEARKTVGKIVLTF